jgi:hypothetical protein
MSAVLDKFFMGRFGDVTTGINHIKIFVADQILIGRCFQGFE